MAAKFLLISLLIGQVPPECISGCTYKQDEDYSESTYCFAPGDLPVSCGDNPQDDCPRTGHYEGMVLQTVTITTNVTASCSKCAQYCLESVGCTHWSYGYPVIQFPTGTCNLFSSVWNFIPYTCCGGVFWVSSKQ
eukprot:GFUD01088984.1.p1 GENE.GFUD01088984.1~~GFUD01088984.1.p1  ORF type:complete len:135 (-),score=8.00 GFUD01088984.1:64-468(-)